MSKKWRGVDMKLYHGSNIAIEKIDLSKGRPAKDFGRGFYLSGDSKQAEAMADNVVRRKGGNPVYQQRGITPEAQVSS